MHPRLPARSVATAAVALGMLVPATAPAPASPDTWGWLDGDIAYTTVTRCDVWNPPGPSEAGIGAATGFLGRLDEDGPRAVVDTTAVHVVAAGIGSPCTYAYVSPQFVLPPGVEWAKDQPITCLFDGQRLDALGCPQWEALAEGTGVDGADWYTNADRPWRLTQAEVLELILPVRSSRPVTSTLTTYLRVADGHASPTLVLQAPVLFNPAPTAGSPAQDLRCQGRRVTVDLAAGERPTSGDDVILGTSRSELVRAGRGHDTVCAGGGADRVQGGPGDDLLVGGAGRDRLVGGAGRDRLVGGPGRDSCRGVTDRRRTCER